MRPLFHAAISVVAILAIGALLSNIPKPDFFDNARAQPATIAGPVGTSVALSTTSGQVIGINLTRHGLQLCNPSAIVEFIAPAPIVPLTGGGVGIGLPAIASGVTSCFTAPLGVPVGQAWNAVSASATPNLTVLEYP
jgi:hypothetical protein